MTRALVFGTPPLIGAVIVWMAMFALGAATGGAVATGSADIGTLTEAHHTVEYSEEYAMEQVREDLSDKGGLRSRLVMAMVYPILTIGIDITHVGVSVGYASPMLALIIIKVMPIAMSLTLAGYIVVLVKRVVR